MKNCDEMVNSLLERREQYTTELKRKKKAAMRIVSAACCFGLAAFIGLGMRQSKFFNNITPTTLDRPSVDGETNLSNNNNTESKENNAVITTPDFPIIWGNETDNNEYGMTEWNGKITGLSLYNALENTANNHRIFAIAASFNYFDSQFVYNEKTLAEYAAEAEYEQQLLGTLMKLLKEGDYLKYGEALYQTGTPDGEKWSKELYDNTVEFYGQDLLSKYIVDGAFLREKVESDIAAYSENKAQKAYETAYDAYINQILETAQKQLSKQNINSERRPKTHYLIIYASADEFSSLSLNHISEWHFGLAIQNSDDGQDLGQEVSNYAE